MCVCVCVRVCEWIFIGNKNVISTTEHRCRCMKMYVYVFYDNLRVRDLLF